jgi:hypothetical protein
MDKNKIQIQIFLENGIKLLRELDDLDTKLMNIRDLLFEYDRRLFDSGNKAVDRLRRFRGQLVAQLVKDYGLHTVQSKISPWPSYAFEYLQKSKY